MTISRRVMHGVARFLQVAALVVLVGLVISMVWVVLGWVTLANVEHLGRVIHDSTLARPYVEGAAKSGLVATIGQHYLNITGGPVTPAVRVAISALLILETLPYAGIVYLMSRLFRNIAQNRVFVRGNARIFIACGCLSLAAAVVGMVVSPVTQALFERFSQTKFFWFGTVHFLPALFEVLVWFIVGGVFTYGLQLQQDADGLV
ncbi:DUF2975 domain-containing protein [Lacticaseibacillus kribbianus]|uniref:DUF2975 domain-containing protein n=1 Tax=Lacticaseibacillus kribbianus TaxID=2926292 RepID=UPI001CD7E03A|nr:DUF2975 domain-containing protein [Lacticaseibacillus kribbianus]